MKIYSLLAILCSGYAVGEELNSLNWYPVDSKGKIPLELETFEYGSPISLDCSSREIERGENEFDEKGKVIYRAFPSCKETGRPLEFRYGINEDIQCTIEFTDKLYHLFQLYVHEDAPFSCRLPQSSESNYLEKGGASIPLIFNFRGEARESHLRIDNKLNVIIVKPSSSKSKQNTVMSAVGWSSGTNLTRIVIGNELPLQLAVRWFDQLENEGSMAGNNPGFLPYSDGFYKLPNPSNAILLRWLLYLPFKFVMSVAYITVFGLTFGGLGLLYYILTKAAGKNRKLKTIDDESGYKHD